MRSEIERYLKEHNINKSEFAEKVGINRATVSQYLSGVSVSEKARHKIEETYLDIAAETAEAEPMTFDGVLRCGDLLQTHDAQGVISVCQSCQDFIGMGMITGRSGYGKSFALKYYARGAKVAYIECNESMTARDLIKAIERVLSLPHIAGSVDDRMDNIKDFFRANSGYLLIIDEADKLITKYTQKKAEILRNIFDQSEMGLVLAGESALRKMIGTYIPRVANRIAFKYELSGLNGEEARCYISERVFDDAASNEMIRRATNERNGCFRLLNRTMENVKRMTSEGEVITLGAVQRASAMMMV